jgi:3-isopropylmalate/(R)-2-methylmalate dehydratase small subunit
MRAFKNFTGLVAPLDKNNVDTDQIIPKQFLKSVVRSGLGAGLFYSWRFTSQGTEAADFVLNQERYRGASILATGANFGCGSSREHAVWALDDYGFRALIAPSFADIFRTNCLKNGLLPVVLDAAVVRRIIGAAVEHTGYRIAIDLERQTIADERGLAVRFDIEPFYKQRLLEGLDDISLTLAHSEKIAAYERSHRSPYPRA